jgi:hypothetical protein
VGADEDDSVDSFKWSDFDDSEDDSDSDVWKQKEENNNNGYHL